MVHRLGLGAEAMVLANNFTKSNNKTKKDHLKVLRALRVSADGDFCFHSFASLEERTGLSRSRVRLAARHLARKGLAVYSSGLWSEDGEPAGSGYAATMLGATVSAILEEGNNDH